MKVIVVSPVHGWPSDLMALNEYSGTNMQHWLFCKQPLLKPIEFCMGVSKGRNRMALRMASKVEQPDNKINQRIPGVCICLDRQTVGPLVQ